MLEISLLIGFPFSVQGIFMDPAKTEPIRRRSESENAKSWILLTLPPLNLLPQR